MGEIRLLTIQETADILRMHRSSISRMIRDGELPCVKIRSRKLVRLQDLHGFIDNHIAKAGERSRED